MRVSQQVKQETRGRILDAARGLFRSNGFDAATTRDIAADAKIATGTLFNYFPTKEAIVLTLVDDALLGARNTFQKREPAAESLEEDLFAFVAAGLRKLRPYRKYIRPLLDACLDPLADDEVAGRIRTEQLEVVVKLMTRHGIEAPPSGMGLQLFWTLYMGVLAFWSGDASPHQEDTLALLDESTKMFASWVRDS